MSRKTALLATVSLTCLAAFSAMAQTPQAAPAIAAPAAAPVNTAAGMVTRAELPGLVKDIIMNDPDMIMQAVQKLRDKQAEDSKKEANEALGKHKDELFNDTTSPSVGDAKTADVTLIEFFDYHCGYCKQLFPSISRIIGEDSKVRVIFREFPILAEDSVTAARAALAVNRIAPDKYFAFHSALMKSSGKFDEKMLLETAKKVGVPADKLKAEMKSKDITAILDKDRALGEALGIRGTPAIIVNNQLIPGALPYDDLKNMISEARAAKAPAAPAPVAAAPAPATPPKPATPAAPAAAAKPAVPAMPPLPTPKN